MGHQETASGGSAPMILPTSGSSLTQKVTQNAGMSYFDSIYFIIVTMSTVLIHATL
jgi:hypothetical protein